MDVHALCKVIGIFIVSSSDYCMCSLLSGFEQINLYSQFSDLILIGSQMT